MMRGFWPLFRLSFKSLLLTTFSFGGGKKRNKPAASGIGAFIFLAALMVYISGTLSFGMGLTLAQAGALDIMLMGMAAMAVLFPLMLTLFSAQPLVFGTKDTDLVLSLPVSAFSLMLARVSALYLEVLVMTELLLLPAGAAWLVFGGGGGAGFIILLALAGVLLAFLPTFAGLVFGGLLSLLVSRLRFKNFFTTLFSLLFFGAIMVGSFSLQSGMDSVVADPAGVSAIMRQSMPPLAWVADAATGQALALLKLAALCLLPFLASTWVFSRFYKGLLTRLASHRLKTDYKLGGLKASGSFSALLKKEMRRFWGSPILVLNTGLMLFLTLAAGVAALIFQARIAAFLSQIFAIPGGAALRGALPAVLLAFYAFTLSTNYYSAVSISLEGKTLWILKEAPLSNRRILAAKGGVNFLLGAGTLALSLPMFAVALGLALPQALAIFGVVLLLCAYISLSGLYINLLLPKMDAENDTLVVKQSASSMVALLSNWLVLGGLVGLYFLMNRYAPGFLVFCLAAAGVLALLCGLFAALLGSSGTKRLLAL